jgi:hypothetical protein
MRKMLDLMILDHPIMAIFSPFEKIAKKIQKCKI